MDSGTWAEWVSALGTVFALIAAVTAVLLQARELRYQREELKAQREELAAQKEELAKTVKVHNEIAKTDRRFGHLGVQVQLAQIAIDHPDVVEATGGSKLGIYHNLWATLHFNSFSVGRWTASQVADFVRLETFRSQSGIDWWEGARDGWLSQATNDASLTEFVDLVDREYQAVKRRLTSTEEA